MKKNLQEIVNACIGLGAAGMLLGVTGYYCLPTLGKITPPYNNERVNQENAPQRHSLDDQYTGIQPFLHYDPTRDLFNLSQGTVIPLDSPMRKENLPSNRKEK